MPDSQEELLRGNLVRTHRAVTRRERAVRAARAVLAKALKRLRRKRALEKFRKKQLQRYLDSQKDKGRKAAVKYAVNHVGVHEAPGYPNSDRGGIIDRWIRDCGMSPGPTAYWCGCFVNACLKAGGVNLPIGVRYTPTILAWARAHEHGLSVISSSEAKPGDIKLYDWEGDGTMDHVGIVLDGPIRGVEGNTQPGTSGDQSNGGGVYLRERAATHYVRVTYPKG